MNDRKIKPLISAILGRVLKAKRMELNLSQYDLADRFEIDRSFISLVESGKHELSVSKIFMLCQALDITPTEFIRLVESEYDKAVVEHPLDNEE
ncbi:helix-turn-helix domain-containing protein [Paenibacillus cymbidii]|uniref:helix-turn-helix domain-containing protein n=1 Tax=Paenibacillus cymbidii TaxID=1639034 RepID=UPI001436C0B5|nr:helix-turn-helix transcriptional regulator [Paenibacillus cymbidii]